VKKGDLHMFKALPTSDVIAYRNGAPDAHGHPPERVLSDGLGNPCRHCLQMIPKNEQMLILAYRPFKATHPYAEVGPIFLCAKDCVQGDSHDMPEILDASPDYLVKGYSKDERIVYGTGAVTARAEMEARIKEIFKRPEVAFLHVRSARNNCLLARVERDT
jgi:hypothetical protein